MPHRVSLPDGRRVDLDYFVEWRPRLWRGPVADALDFLGDLQGKRLLEIGGRSGRMASLFALRGAHVTMLEKCSTESALAETSRQGVSDRVRLVRTQGDFTCIAGEEFDAIFTKSVLWCIEDLAGFLDQIRRHLAPHGKVAFAENYRGSKTLFWLRRHVIHRRRFPYESRYYGIAASHIPLFRERFADLRAKRYRYFVWGIFGHAT